jgi:ATP-dependent Clp protease ATP-binding subunit ClpA
LDEAANLSIRGGKCYVGVEDLFQALVANEGSLPESLSTAQRSALQKTAQFVQADAWRGIAPAVAGEVYYTPRAATLTSEASRLAEKLHSGATTGGHLLLAILSDAHASPSRMMDAAELDRGRIVESLRTGLLQAAKAANLAPLPAQLAATEGKKTAIRDDSHPVENFQGVDSLTRDLTALARNGRLAPAVGRDAEIYEIIEILARKGKHNVILVGEAGVGKTKVAEGLAVETAKEGFRQVFGNKQVLELEVASLMTGTQYRGAFEEKVQALLNDLKSSPDTILFIDEIHLIMGAGSTDGDGMDLANLLKPALGRGDLHCIGATTLQEYRQFIAKDPAIERRFQMVRIEPLTAEASLTVLKSLAPSLEKHHGVSIHSASLEAAISLTERYLPHRIQAALRESPAAEGESQSTITPHAIRKVVSQAAAVPLEDISTQERALLVNLEQRLKQRIVGQDEAIAKVAAAVKKSRAGLADPDRPDAVMLFLGPTGVGKTQLAKELASEVFGSNDHLISFDMSEYTESHSVSRLIGAPPGYVGSEKEGILTSAVQDAPFSILLFDEIEKAHPQIFDIFLPILEEGRLKDSNGRSVDFRNALIIFTSNIGSEQLYRAGDGDQTQELMDALREHFRPELVNRIDEIVPFYPLLREDVHSVLRVLIDRLRQRLHDKKIGIHMYNAAYEYLADKGYSDELGARELRRCIEREIAVPISEQLLANAFGPGDMIEVSMEGETLTFRKGKPHTKSKKKEATA